MGLARLVGVLLMVVGVLLAVRAIPLATVVYPQYFWYELHPGGTRENPTIVSPGGTVVLSAKLVFFDATVGVELPTPNYWRVEVLVAAPDYSTAVTLRFKDTASIRIESNYCAIGIFEGTWTVPPSEGVLYTITWRVTVADSSGKVWGTLERTTYAKVASTEPDGVFRLNGVDASQVSVLVIDKPEVRIEFVPTKNAEKITRVYVEVVRGTSKDVVTLSKSGAQYAATYTLREYGTYTFRGFVEWAGGPVQKMSVTARWGEEGPAFPLSHTQVLGAVAAVAGAFLTFRRR